MRRRVSWALAAASVSCALLRPTYDEQVRGATLAARDELLEFSKCSSHRAGTCANDPTLRFVESSNGFVWAQSWHDANGRQVAARSGNCVSRGPELGGVPRCAVPEDGGLDLCEVALGGLVVTGATVMDWPDGGPRERSCPTGRHVFDFGHFALALEFGVDSRGPLTVRVDRIDDGSSLREVHDDASGPPLSVGQPLSSLRLALERAGGPRAIVDLAIALRYELAPDAGG